MPWAPKTHRQREIEKQGGTAGQSWVKRERTGADRFRGSAAWQRFRKWFRREHPLCQLCDDDGRVEPATDIHHIVGIMQAPDRALDESNVVALCRDCHQRIEVMNKKGQQTSHLFNTGGANQEDVG